MSIVLILHVVGLFGLNSIYFERFEQLTPLNLLITFLLIVSVANAKRLRFILFFCFAFCLGMVVEIIGVQTGYPFGAYYYTSTLGLAVAGVPLLIGLNWFILAYGLWSLTNAVLKNGHYVLKSLVAALFMTGLDVLIEPFAITHKLWVWQNNIVPPQNYLAWFLISFIIFFGGSKLLPEERNRMGIFTMLVFILFFGLNLFID